MLYLDQLAKSFRASESRSAERVRAVDGVSLTVEEGKLFALLGPSGCGKTTTLRMVAGLERPDRGSIVVGERVLYSSSRHINVPAHRRGLGMVFQSYAIWPHLTVEKNVSFALRGLKGDRRVPRRELGQRVADVLELVGLQDLHDRSATKLSGGQQQRLALARALAARPPVLLLDEPLSNLDLKLREGLRLELKRMQRDLGITTLYVTHDQTEAMALANVVAIMNRGRIIQAGSPRTVYNLPDTRFVADFVGKINLIDGIVVGGSVDRGYVIDTPNGKLHATSRTARSVGHEVAVGVRPENVILTPGNGGDGSNTWCGSVERREFLGEAADFHIRVGKVPIRVRSDPSLSVHEGDDVRLRFPQDACAVMEND